MADEFTIKPAKGIPVAGTTLNLQQLEASQMGNDIGFDPAAGSSQAPGQLIVTQGDITVSLPGITLERMSPEQAKIFKEECRGYEMSDHGLYRLLYSRGRTSDWFDIQHPDIKWEVFQPREKQGG